MEALDSLEYYINWEDNPDIDIIAEKTDDVQHQLDEEYIRLPIDNKGRMWKEGDRAQALSPSNPSGTITSMVWRGGFWYFTIDDPKNSDHYSYIYPHYEFTHYISPVGQLREFLEDHGDIQEWDKLCDIYNAIRAQYGKDDE